MVDAVLTAVIWLMGTAFVISGALFLIVKMIPRFDTDAVYQIERGETPNRPSFVERMRMARARKRLHPTSRRHRKPF